jgi:hypothetical protein
LEKILEFQIIGEVLMSRIQANHIAFRTRLYERIQRRPGAVTHACYPSYMGDGDQKNMVGGQSRQKIHETPISLNGWTQ